METTYKRGTKEYTALEAAAKLLELASPNGTKYRVEDCYFDYGQKWMWTTIVAYKPDGNYWQALCPRDHEHITDYGTDPEHGFAEILKAVRNTIDSKFNPDK